MVWYQSLASSLNRSAADDLVSALKVLHGRKALYCDEAFFDQRLGFARTFDLFLSEAVSSEANFATIQVLGDDSLDTALEWLNADVKNFVFFIRSSRNDTARLVARVVKTLAYRDKRATFLAICVPFSSKLVDTTFAEAGVHGDIILRSLELGFLGIEDDLLSLDWPGAIRELWVETDESCVRSCAQALQALEKHSSTNFTVLRSVGDYSKAVVEQLLKYKKSGNSLPKKNENLHFQTPEDLKYSNFARREELDNLDFEDEVPEQEEALLLVIDRSVDMITPFLTQWTYEGMLDEVFDMTNDVVEIEKEILVKDKETVSSETLLGDLNGQRKGLIRKRMSNEDPIYHELRELNFTVAIKRIGNVATGLRSFYASRPSEKNSDIEEVKNFVRTLGTKKNETSWASMHTALAEEVSSRTFENEFFRRRFELERRMLDGSMDMARCKEYIMECAAMQDKVTNILRVLALCSHTQGPIARNLLQEFTSVVQDAYGIEWLPLLHLSEVAGLIQPSWKNEEKTWSSPVAGSRFEGAGYSWLIASDHLRLVHEYDPDQKEQQEDAAYSGFVPVSARLVQFGLTQNKWLSSVNQTIARKTLLPGGERATEHVLSHGKAFPKRAMVVILGGATRSELAAMTSVVRRYHPASQVVFAPTSLISAGRIFAELLPPRAPS